MNSYSPDKPATLAFWIMRSIVRFLRMARVRLMTGGRLKFGRNAYIAKGSDLYIPDRAVLGNNVSIGANFFVQTNFEIGDDCLISSNVSFVGNDHDIYGGRSSYFSGRFPPSSVVLEGNNFVGFGSTIVGTVRIGKDSVIGAGSLVIDDVPPNTVVVGVPARFLKCRY